MNLGEMKPVASMQGIPVFTTEHMKDIVQLKRHKKWRTNKKWNKRYGILTKQIPSRKVVNFDNKLFMHPWLFEKMKESDAIEKEFEITY